MKRPALYIIIGIVIIGGALLLAGRTQKPQAPAPQPAPAINPPTNNKVTSTPMQLTSSAFNNGEPLPMEYSCDGSGEAPPLSADNIPPKAQTLALILEDPDAPNGTFTHWIVWNLPPSAKTITASNLPKGAEQGMNDFGKVGYGAPCPPSGSHRYTFTLFALDEPLDLKSGTKAARFKQALTGHVLEEATLTGYYQRR